MILLYETGPEAKKMNISKGFPNFTLLRLSCPNEHFPGTRNEDNKSYFEGLVSWFFQLHSTLLFWSFWRLFDDPQISKNKKIEKIDQAPEIRQMSEVKPGVRSYPVDGMDWHSE